MLSNDDREWLEEKFSRIHDRIDNVEQTIAKKGSDIHRIDKDVAKLMAGECDDIQKHEEKYHNPSKTWGTIGAVVGVVTAVVESLKWFIRRGGA